MSIDSEHPICVKQCDKQDEKVDEYETIERLCRDHPPAFKAKTL